MFRVPYKTHPHKNIRRGWVGVDCNRCSPNSHKYRLGFELPFGRSHCWVCGRFWPPEILSVLCRRPKAEIYDLVGGKWGSASTGRFQQIEHTGTLTLPKGVGEIQTPHFNYLVNRGFEPTEIVPVWNIQGIGLAQRLQWRLFIPIFDELGKMVSWTTRSIGKENPRRYHSASPEEESVPHKSLLYGAHYARHVILIFEGPLDVWAVGPGSVCTCGVGFSQEQLNLMAEYPYRVVCFDAEEDAQKRADDLCKQLSAFPGVTENIILETGKDPAEASKAEIRQIQQRYFPERFV